ncbi:MAG: 23S rRNA pseudouridine(955/2504/2580) synthase RluC [Gammaproteobacteria bacterium]|nr:23S rRNA pseudouridine(955/2504/2580) synthase RluC [Gammaproteobacteria bacterium]MCW9030221.1 23S rRNA pseudouridine(955/2504/2580) synthase RluC [Gammaproteobacteria bacterium]
MSSNEQSQAPVQPSKAQFVEISADHAGQRLDNYLLCQLKGVPKSLVYRIVRKGEVRVNKGRIKPEYRLKEGDIVRIPPVRLAEKKEPGKASDKVLELIESRILYEDNRILVLNKPSGLAVHGGSGLSYGVIEALRELRPNDKQLELVHRLDRDTSGCLIIAKKRSALRRLHEQLREGTMDKRYLTLLKGKWKGANKWVDAPLLKNVIRSGERLVFVDPKGKDARTQFIPYCVAEEASLMSVKLDTGRTHQIRVHAQHLGFPIAGDEKYGDDEFTQQMKGMGLKRLFLHAYSLKFHLPETDTGEDAPIYVEAPLDEPLVNVLNKLKISL